jgi:hypothetical protein
MGGIAKAVVKPVRARAVPLLPAWKLTNSMQWVLCWEDLEVTGPTATWVHKTLQNTYSTDYLRKQPAGLFRSHAPQGDVRCKALVGEEWAVIVEADASSRLLRYARLCEGDAEQEISLGELEEGILDEASALRARESVEATALEVDAPVRLDDEAVTAVEYSPDPDVRLIRNIWARKGVLERVCGVKFMCGIFACNELPHRRFGRLDSSSCSCCTGTDEAPWHVISECNDADPVDTRTCWADRMWDVLQKETAVQKGKTALRVDMANAVRRLLKVDADGRIPAWAPGTTALSAPA